MESANQLILVASGLVLISVFAGTVSSRIGAPLLLVFLVLGMLAGEDGPGGIDFDDFELTYTVGSVALTLILFDGGLRTRWPELRRVALPAALLSTLGVLVTAGLTGAAAKFVLGVNWLEGLTIGSIVASTDAAAVFLLLHLRGMRLRDRLRSLLEAEAGLNDPMAVMLTITCVGLLVSADATLGTDSLQPLAAAFALQIVGGTLIGVLGGFGLLALLNRLNAAPGVYPVLAAAAVLLLFAAAQQVGASGFLAAYLAGLVVGNNRHKASMLIDKFMDALAWLCQISMFLILGLLVTPSSLGAVLVPALLVAAVLIVLARPVAMALVLPWFGFGLRETAFVSWVGLRGAVPIFLGTIPVLSGTPHSESVFGIVYVIVLTSLVVQGWTVGPVGRRLGVLLPPRPDAPPRMGIDLPSNVGQDMAAYAVQPNSLALRRPLARLPVPDDVTLVSVIRDGAIHKPDEIERLSAGDDVLLMASTERLDILDRVFGSRPERADLAEIESLGGFMIDRDAPLGDVADAYGFRVPAARRGDAVGDFMTRHLGRRTAVGVRLPMGAVDLIVYAVEKGTVRRVLVDIDPAPSTRRFWRMTRVYGRAYVGLPLGDALAGRWRAIRKLAVRR